jgi:hypothetical protein
MYWTLTWISLAIAAFSNSFSFSLAFVTGFNEMAIYFSSLYEF